MNGKGDKDRTADREAYYNNYDRIFGKRCEDHPRYRGIGKPRSNCTACWRIWEEATAAEFTGGRP